MDSSRAESVEPAVASSLAATLAEAARILAAVAAGRSLSTAFDRAADKAGVPRASLLDLTHGTLRRFGRVQALARRLSRRGRSDPVVEALLWCAFYALDSARYAQHTVVDQAVRACGIAGRRPAQGFVNAVLRNLLRNRSAIERQIAAEPEARWQHPSWWIESVQASHPDAWQRVLEAGNSHPPMSLRVNERRISIREYRERLENEHITAKQVDSCALLLDKPVPVSRLPGFGAGLVSVQDAGAQRAAPYLDLAPRQRVLDACAAPGGKAAHLLELADVDLTALDVDATRCQLVERNLARLGLAARVRVADCTQVEKWWDSEPFARILADVPCSASGVARRHPDIKWLRRASDLAAFSARQSEILDVLWRVLAPGGKLLYVTCSVFREENDSVVESFTARTPKALRLPLPNDAASTLLPGPDHDGFFFALLAKPN